MARDDPSASSTASSTARSCCKQHSSTARPCGKQHGGRAACRMFESNSDLSLCPSLTRRLRSSFGDAVPRHPITERRRRQRVVVSEPASQRADSRRR